MVYDSHLLGLTHFTQKEFLCVGLLLTIVNIPYGDWEMCAILGPVQCYSILYILGTCMIPPLCEPSYVRLGFPSS